MWSSAPQFLRRRRLLVGALVSVGLVGGGVAAALVVAAPAGNGGSAGADPAVAAGRQVAEACTVCHGLERSSPFRVGPPLWDIVGAPKARFDGFGYTRALALAGGRWNEAELDAFLADPAAHHPGTSMIFAGLDDAADRANLIAYLKTLTD